MAEKRITKIWLKNYLSYNWWKYLLLTVLCGVCINMLFSITAYRVPEEKKLEVFACNGYTDVLALQQMLWEDFSVDHPDQEELTVMNIDLTSDDIYKQMQFGTYFSAQQGDICLLPESMVLSLTEEAADYSFLELTPYIESGVIDVTGIDMTGSVFKNEAGEEGVYAIPADALYGLYEYGTNPDDSYLCIMVYGGNDDNAAALLGRMIELFGAENAGAYDQTHNADGELSVIFN